MEPILISDNDFNDILTEVGVPYLLQLEDIEIPESVMKNTLFANALRYFFNFFPITDEKDYTVSGSFKIDFPDESTFSAYNCQLNNNSINAGGSLYSQSKIVNAQNWSQSNSGIYGGRGYDYQMRQANIMRRTEAQSYISNDSAFKVTVKEAGRYVEGYTNITGRLSITWAKFSNNFDDIPFRFKDDVIKLCKINLLRALAMIRGQMAEAGTSGTFNVDLFKDRADTLEEEVKTKFKQFSKVALQRM